MDLLTYTIIVAIVSIIIYNIIVSKFKEFLTPNKIIIGLLIVVLISFFLYNFSNKKEKEKFSSTENELEDRLSKNHI